MPRGERRNAKSRSPEHEGPGGHESVAAWVDLLARAGIEAVHWSGVGPMNAPDAVIMAHASANDFVVLTHDLDFSAILAATHGEKPSVVQLRADDVSPDVIGHQVVAALRQMHTDLHEGALITIDPGRTRLRVLPLRAKP